LGSIFAQDEKKQRRGWPAPKFGWRASGFYGREPNNSLSLNFLEEWNDGKRKIR
jgi:hypothetical protein